MALALFLLCHVAFLCFVHAAGSNAVQHELVRVPLSVVDVVHVAMSTGYRLGKSGMWQNSTTAKWETGLNSVHDRCVETPSLTVEKVRKLANKAWNTRNTSVVVQKCPTKVFYNSFGKACQYPQEFYLGTLYDTALFFMILGADAKSSFSPFAHARMLAQTIQSCQPQFQILDTVTIPDSYQVLYELYFTNLIAELRSTVVHGRRLSVPSDMQMQQVIRSVKEKRNEAISGPLSQRLGLGLICSKEEILEVTQSWGQKDPEPIVRDVVLQRFPIFKAAVLRSFDTGRSVLAPAQH